MSGPEELARRAVACKGFRWMPGMLAQATSKHWPEHAPEPTRVDERQLSVDGEPVNDQWTAVPDLADPATLGCLLALVREAWLGWVIELVVSDAGASVCVTDIDRNVHRRFAGPILAPCLVGALEASP